MIKIPDYVLSAITVMEGPSFVYKTDAVNLFILSIESLKVLLPGF